MFEHSKRNIKTEMERCTWQLATDFILWIYEWSQTQNVFELLNIKILFDNWINSKAQAHLGPMDIEKIYRNEHASAAWEKNFHQNGNLKIDQSST